MLPVVFLTQRRRVAEYAEIFRHGGQENLEKKVIRIDSPAVGDAGRGKKFRGLLIMAYERATMERGEEGVERERREPVRERRAKIASMARSLGAGVKRKRRATQPDEARFARIAREARDWRAGTSDEPRFHRRERCRNCQVWARSRPQPHADDSGEAICDGLRPEANLMIAERSLGHGNRPHQFIEYGCLDSRPSL